MRRSRFTVVLEGREPFVTLAYSATQIRKAYGFHNVVTVTKGDFRKKVRATPTGGGFQIDARALKQAIALLGLKVPVKVRQHSRVGNTHGNYRFRASTAAKPQHHDIMLKSYLTPAEASHTLWHELTHALQAERCGSLLGWAAESRKQRSYSYHFRPVEIEANRMADKMSDHVLCY